MTIVLTAGAIALIGADHAPAAKVKTVTLTLAGSFVNDGSTIEVDVPRLTDSGTVIGRRVGHDRTRRSGARPANSHKCCDTRSGEMSQKLVQHVKRG